MLIPPIQEDPHLVSNSRKVGANREELSPVPMPVGSAGGGRGCSGGRSVDGALQSVSNAGVMVASRSTGVWSPIACSWTAVSTST